MNLSLKKKLDNDAALSKISVITHSKGLPKNGVGLDFPRFDPLATLNEQNHALAISVDLREYVLRGFIASADGHQVFKAAHSLAVVEINPKLVFGDPAIVVIDVS